MSGGTIIHSSQISVNSGFGEVIDTSEFWFLPPYAMYNKLSDATLLISESAPTSPRPPTSEAVPISMHTSPTTSSAGGMAGGRLTSDPMDYIIPVLSSSAPELEGMWTEVKRKVREKPRTPKKEVCSILVLHYSPQCVV